MVRNKGIPRLTSAGSRSISFRGTAPPPENGRGLPCYGQAFFLIPNKVSLAVFFRELFLNEVALRALYTGAPRRGGCGQPRYHQVFYLILKTVGR